MESDLSVIYKMDWSHFHFEMQASNWISKEIKATADLVSKGLTTLQDGYLTSDRGKTVLLIGSGLAGLYFTVKAFRYYKKVQRR